MKCRGIFKAVILLALLSGCATLPGGPSVTVLPTRGKPFETFQKEDATCRQWAQSQVGSPVQQTYDKNLATGAVAGTAIGAGLGAALGSASGHAGAGALIGGLYGLFFGSATGANAAQVNSREAQRRYDNAYVQCMYSYGNQIPGYRVAPARPRVAVAPPPPAPAPPDLGPAPETSEVPGDYQPPPEVYLDEAPQFIYSPDLNAYVAVGTSYDLLYSGNEYFYFYGGRWYHGPYYNGPWVYAARSPGAPVFLRYRIDFVRGHRDAEFRRYEHDRTHYGGRFHRPEFRGDKRRAGRKEEHR